ncbi:hypothetical protein [Dipodfec virus RodF1_72]|uniref:Uncharacterized protein n=1 Tax=Dipodfec virus RodF1_72 TaxID=2929309 RepID=A0A976N2M9_9VIRU|nr:hypothetical protein [Dipodfec virus RodF1_72]
MVPRIYNQLSPPPIEEEFNSGNVLAVPDLSLSVPDIIRMALDGNTDFPMLMENDDGEVFDISKSDLTDRFPNADYGFDDDYDDVTIPSPSPASPVVPSAAPSEDPPASPSE